jgi:class 3 adenylate cyclase
MKTAPAVADDVKLIKSVRGIAMKGAADRYPARQAVLVEGVHLYGQLTNFEDMVADRQRTETEASHRKVLEFLDAHYRVWDSLVEDAGALTVDFHGPRLHAVLTDPPGNHKEQIERAIALANVLRSVADQLAKEFGFPTEIRFGIDHGRCLAMTTGRSHEADTLFLGSPANHAAKLAANENKGGIFLTPEAMAILRGNPANVIFGSSFEAPSPEIIQRATAEHQFTKVTATASQVIRDRASQPAFTFHRSAPPLSGVKFADLVPSKTLRMGMASIFADIDGYTAFVDNAIRGGPEAVKLAVLGVHTIREELNSVLKEDFSGKRVRFIGDCIHGLVAVWKGAEDDPAKTVKSAAECAAAMRSSFDLCCEMIKGLHNLDLAVGIEYGTVPLTRMGRPGDQSVRCAAGKAVIVSERKQQEIEGGGIRLGDNALRVAPEAVVKFFGKASRILAYDEAVNLLGSEFSPVNIITKEVPEARSYAQSVVSDGSA